jgi:hypothetical protein
MVFSPVVGRQYPAKPSRRGLDLKLSDCSDGDYPAGDSVCLLGFGAMGAKTNDLFTVGALAKGAKGTRHVVGGLGWAD